jgi:beta-fructofuranosidase
MRPEFHFTAQSGWINDPHGITYRNGGYDAFFQYVPDSMVWAPNCHWGHSRGTDLFSLTELEVALEPGDGDDGIWTGSIIHDAEGHAKLFYTSVKQPNIGIGTVRVATPLDDDWIRWRKGAQVAEAPESLDIVAYRDPFVVADGDAWNMFVGAGLNDGTATALRYSSENLAEWDYEGISLQRSTRERSPVWTGALWECPQFFEVDGRAVMISSVWDDNVLFYAGYSVGQFIQDKFVAENWGQLSFGPSYYAPSFFRDATGQPCVMFWMRGIEDQAERWASAHSLPYVLTLSGDQLVATLHHDIDNYLLAPINDGDRVDGLAALTVWQPSDDHPSIEIASAGSTLVRLELEASDLVIERDDESWTMPYGGGDVAIVLDGPVLELSTSTGIFGLAIDPRGATLEFIAPGSTTHTRALSRMVP